MTVSASQQDALDQTEDTRSPRGVRAAGDAEQPQHVFLTAAEVIARYGWGRTKGYRVLRGEGFPRPVGGDRYRLDTLIAWENRQLQEPVPPRSLPMLPPRKRRPVRSG